MIERLGAELSRELGRLGPGGAIGEIVERWPAAVGEQIAAHAWPARVTRDGTLVAHARDSIWAFELTQRAREILPRLGELPLTGLKFVPGPLPAPGGEAAPVAPPDVPQPGPDEERQAADLVAEIEHVELRESVQRAVMLSLARARSDRSFW